MHMYVCVYIYTYVCIETDKNVNTVTYKLKI